MSQEPKKEFKWDTMGDRVVLKRIEAEEKTTGGIIIPDVAKDKPIKGVIIALGESITHNEEGYKRRDCKFYVGQTVVFGKYAGNEWTDDDGTEYIIMRELDIFLIPKQ